MLDERRDLLPPFAQRRQRQAHHVQAVEEIAAEAAVGHQLLDAGIGRGNHAHVDLHRVRFAERMDLVGFEEAQQLRLHFRSDLANLVEEQRPAGRGRITPGTHVGAGEGALAVAEQLALEQIAGTARS